MKFQRSLRGTFRGGFSINRAVDLNIDIGEGGGQDATLLALASSANIACGGHAGGGDVMTEALVLAQAAGVAIGAHPGYADRANFGRVETGESPAAIADEVKRQLSAFLDAHGAMPHHVKPHGALYHRAEYDAPVAHAICEVIAGLAPNARVYGFAGGGLAAAAKAAGLVACGEGFIDRTYRDDGRLVPRDCASAVIESPADAAAQSLRLAANPQIATLCVHGDGVHAVEILRAARAALTAAGISIAAP
jgi:UPF0271 protein